MCRVYYRQPPMRDESRRADSRAERGSCGRQREDIMSCYIIADSCCDLTEPLKQDPRVCIASLSIEVGGYHLVDDETFDQKDFLRRVAASPEPPHSACPTPEVYKSAFENPADHLYAVTLSARLSGSCNSAQLGRTLCLEEHPEKKIHVFDSKSASIGETLIVRKILECEDAGMPFEQVVETVEEYISTQTTWFVLESLEALRKNGRLSNVKALVASVLNIKPVMKSTAEGDIMQYCKCRGINRALMAMVQNIEDTVDHPEERILGISHCNCPERAMMLRDEIASRMNLKEIFVVDTAGISSLYASDGGVIIVA